MLNQEQLAFLAEILPCWKAMDREHQRLLERTMTERSVKRGEYLYQGDRDCTGVFWMRYGQARVFLISGKADHPLPALGAGQLLSVRILRHQKYQF